MNTKNSKEVFCERPSHRFLMGYLILISSPYLTIRKATGIRGNETKASKLLPQPRPRAWYILRPQRGSTAPKILLTTVLAARADAAYRVKVSTSA